MMTASTSGANPDTLSLEDLKSLSRFVRAVPPTREFQELARAEAHLKPHVRLQMVWQQTLDLDYGRSREAQLAQAGFSAREFDSRAFAQAVVVAMKCHLSLEDLENLAAEFKLAHAQEVVRRAPQLP